MLIGLGLLLAIASVPLAGGRLSRLAGLRFRHTWLALLAFAVQVVVLEVVPEGAGAWHRGFHLWTYALLALFVAVNVQHVRWLWLIGLGGALNGVAIAANDGVMPARPAALAAAGLEQDPTEFINSTVVEDPQLWFLGDVFAVPAAWPLANVFSVGDVLLVLGAVLALHAVAGSGVRRRARWLAAA